ncbi:MAG: HipA domain-containing protein [Bryobacteraceae bacterium]
MRMVAKFPSRQDRRDVGAWELVAHCLARKAGINVLQSQGAHANEDSRELFRRVVFSILIHNADGHLRNHGFLLHPEGITLSPAFDINPAIDRNELTLAINDVESSCDVEIALETHRSYGLAASEAKAIVSKARKAVSSWRSEAARFRIPIQKQELMAKAFA